MEELTFVKDLLQTTSKKLEELTAQGLFGNEWLLAGKKITGSLLHGRVWAVLSQSVMPPYYPIIEARFGRSFRPDLCVTDQSDKIIAIVEYESVNSSDERIEGKDLINFGLFSERKELSSVKWWIILSSLPNQRVRGWNWWGWNKDPQYGPPKKCKKSRDANPFKYYEDSMHSAFKNTWNDLEKKAVNPPYLIWANLSPGSLKILNINGTKTDPSMELNWPF